MFIDLHMHEMTYSEDSFLKLEEIVIVAKARGLQGICITDHDSMGLKEYAKEYSKQVDFPIFVGIEYYSLQGDILAFGIDDFPKERLNAQEFITLVKEQGGVCFSAHP
ncbi:MAG: PHP domain-containing protein, partial [Lachnospiraceae bacterium]